MSKKKNYSEKDLVEFGLYLLSKKREDLLSQNESDLSARLRMVHDADLSNWQSNKNTTA